jgi:hypothetical protein
MSIDKTEIASRMRAQHLEGLDEQEMKNDIEQAIPPTPEKEVDSLENPKSNREYPFLFQWEDSKGKRWEGKFVNKILSVGEQSMVGVMRARLAAGAPIEALDPLTVEINLMIAHMTFSLVEKPEWANDLRGLLDVGLLQAIYMEVSSHEAFFFGRKAFIEES